MIKHTILFSVIDKICPLCGCKTAVVLPREGLTKWKATHEPVHVAFPGVEASVRETLISGLCGDCQADVFAQCPDRIGIDCE